METWRGIIERYRHHLSVTDMTPVVTLYEGGTPLLKTANLGKFLKQDINLFFKYEGTNPSGSFKDRGMTLAISKAVETGAKAVICASTGNTSASASAYAAKAGIAAIVLIPEGQIAMGKLAQAMIHNARVLQVQGNFDEALEIVKKLVEKHPVTLVNSINPFRLEGQKTAAFEVCDALGGAPDYHALPVGNAGNITAYWRGYSEYKKTGVISGLPKMLGFQASGAAPVVLGRAVDEPDTIATAIRIGNPASWEGAVAARDKSGGRIDAVTDEEIIRAYRLIASKEGIFCEPASAASLAGVIKLSKEGYFSGGETVVCTLTGNGLKDPDTALNVSEKPAKVTADVSEVEKHLKDIL